MSLTISPILPTTYVSAAAAESPQSVSRKRPLQEEVCTPIFDVEFLCAAISGQLMESPRGDEKRCAEALSIMNPDILMQFSIYRPSEVHTIFAKHLKETEYSNEEQVSINKTIKHLCVSSVLNSRYRETVSILEERIDDYLKASAKERFQEIITSTKELLLSPPTESLPELQGYSAALNKIGADIDQALDLFFYASDDCKECIKILARETTRYDGAPRYPSCKQNFRQLCQNLNILSNEKLELTTLRTQIRERLGKLHTQIQPFYQAEEKKEERLPSTVMSVSRARFCNQEIPLLWEVGGKLLQKTFLATLKTKKTNIRRSFAEAITESANMNPLWTHLQFTQLFPRAGTPAFPKFDEGFVGNVWGTYTKEISHLVDLGDFMRHFINAIPQKWFQKLTIQQDKSKALEQVFFNFFGKDATFITLKEWALKQKPLKEP